MTETLLKLALFGVSGAFPKRPELPYEAWVRLASASAAALTNDALCSSAHASTARARDSCFVFVVRPSVRSPPYTQTVRRAERRDAERSRITGAAASGLASPSRESS